MHFEFPRNQEVGCRYRSNRHVRANNPTSRTARRSAFARCAAVSLHRLRALHWTSIVTLTLSLYGCGGGSSAPAKTYIVGGTVTGLGDESGLVLTNEGSDATVVPALAVTFKIN